jgi:hypothetical protein
VLTVACVLRSGGIYDATWVARLKAGVERHLPAWHRFVCLSDVDVPDRIPLEHNWPGWWSKIELFMLDGPVLYFDLDTAIVGGLCDIAEHACTAGFTMLRDFYAPDHCGSGVMSWSGGVRPIYREFAEAPGAAMRKQRTRMGDQAFIEEATVNWAVGRWQYMLPDQIVSYKVHCQNGIPPNARVVCLHGTPKFKDMPANDPVRLEWERP